MYMYMCIVAYELCCLWMFSNIVHVHVRDTVDWEIFICRNFRLLYFRRVIFSSLSTPMKIKRVEN